MATNIPDVPDSAPAPLEQPDALEQAQHMSELARVHGVAHPNVDPRDLEAAERLQWIRDRQRGLIPRRYVESDARQRGARFMAEAREAAAAAAKLEKHRAGERAFLTENDRRHAERVREEDRQRPQIERLLTERGLSQRTVALRMKWSPRKLSEALKRWKRESVPGVNAWNGGDPYALNHESEANRESNPKPARAGQSNARATRSPRRR